VQRVLGYVITNAIVVVYSFVAERASIVAQMIAKVIVIGHVVVTVALGVKTSVKVAVLQLARKMVVWLCAVMDVLDSVVITVAEDVQMVALVTAVMIVGHTVEKPVETDAAEVAHMAVMQQVDNIKYNNFKVVKFNISLPFFFFIDFL
jgi:hypothetical protein